MSKLAPLRLAFIEKVENATGSVSRDLETEPGLTRYIEESAGVDSGIRQKIVDGAQGRPIIVWGTGTHTLRLLASGARENIRIAGFVDSNPKYQGQLLHGAPVLSPAEPAQRQEPILVSSRGFQREISNQIRNTLGLNMP